MNYSNKLLSIVLTVCFLVSKVDGSNSADDVFRVTAPPTELKLSSFYKKYVSAEGYPVVSSEKVNDYALKEAAYLINMMLAKRPDVRKVMIRSGSRMIVMGYNEFTTDIPEHAHQKPKDYWDRRARGLGGSRRDPVCSCGEENLLAYPGDPYAKECILIHEFAHNLHLRGLIRVDPTFDERLKKSYDAAMAQNLWKGKYASVNKNEYFAEGVQSWFDNNRPPDHDHNHVDTRKELKEYDPPLAALCAEVFGDTELVYTKPGTRLTGHLAGYDSSQAPTFRWPKRLEAVGKEIRRKAKQRGKPVYIKHQIKDIEGWQVHIDESLLADEHADLGELAIRILTSKLHRISLIMPSEQLKKLREVPIYLDREHELGPMQYHPNSGWLKSHGYDTNMTKAVHIPRARGMISLEKKQTQQWVVLHELSHAYHDRVLGFNHKAIRSAYDRAKEAGLYEKVLHIRGHQTRHYALTDHKEFFAEMTEAYFGVNDMYPFVRGELKNVDPDTFKLLEQIWGKRR